MPYRFRGALRMQNVQINPVLSVLVLRIDIL